MIYFRHSYPVVLSTEKLNLNSISGSTSGIGTQSEKSSSFASGDGTVRIEQSGGGNGGFSGSVGRVTVTNGSEFSRAPGCEKKLRGEFWNG